MLFRGLGSMNPVIVANVVYVGSVDPLTSSISATAGASRWASRLPF
jgi:hypothetical protein